MTFQLRALLGWRGLQANVQNVSLIFCDDTEKYRMLLVTKFSRNWDYFARYHEKRVGFSFGQVWAALKSEVEVDPILLFSCINLTIGILIVAVLLIEY
jgi:hypothetical protein